ncbi:hypothetical protein NE237_014645 [Protea cynaroides]|uniref:(+)-neomenthol dehydrogenase-like n=1 Tax=Protea cynaroides TaxID=273540 RepID=A0A9Q0KCL9_9MAGN|nr:hypothetical protein NE237_014645 [Protea cynaroides]
MFFCPLPLFQTILPLRFPCFSVYLCQQHLLLVPRSSQRVLQGKLVFHGDDHNIGLRSYEAEASIVLQREDDSIQKAPPWKLTIVTGANKGIGLEICRQLATISVKVVLTARDEKKGAEAVEKLKGSGLSAVVFHQLDVMDPASIASLVDFIRTQFGKLDILVTFGT